jgi:23S rRNA (cytidine1920-2'-O)/16S rRNA (cytidine1409-2'-O)-methyltransferase
LKTRIDQALVDRGLCESRSQAQRSIMAGQVRINGHPAQKPSDWVRDGDTIELLGADRYVSRGGHKLEHALHHFALSVQGFKCIDLGASTGGFTDCLLQRGVVSMTCVDVGTAQLHSKLRNDPRIKNLEKFNAREINTVELPHRTYGIVVMDLSFISLRLVLPAAWERTGKGGHLVALIKPQFEATRAEADKAQGIIKDPVIHARVVDGLTASIQSLPGAQVLGVIPSPIEGRDGNKEFLIAVKRA